MCQFWVHSAICQSFIHSEDGLPQCKWYSALLQPTGNMIQISVLPSEMLVTEKSLQVSSNLYTVNQAIYIWGQATFYSDTDVAPSGAAAPTAASAAVSVETIAKMMVKTRASAPAAAPAASASE